MRRGAFLLSFIFLVSTPRISSACSCFQSPTFIEVAKSRDHLLVGRVLEVGRPHGVADKDEVAYVDLRVTNTLKGAPSAQRVRVWDGYHATSCAGSLNGLAVGSLVAMAVGQSTDAPSDAADPSAPAATSGRSGHRITAAKTDYFLGVCGPQWEVLSDERAIASLRLRLSKGAGKK